MIIKPDFLQTGDLVSIISPAGPIDEQYIVSAQRILESWGLSVLIGSYATNSFGAFAGTDEHRREDLQNALNNPDVRAIFCARGGYGAIRVFPFMDYSVFLNSPKWVIGFSDITVAHAYLNSVHVASVHAAMPINFETVKAESLQSLHAMLFGTKPVYSFSSSQYNRYGKATGRLIGGNLSVLQSLRDLSFEYDFSDTILCIEEVGEYDYHIDRMLQNLKLSGILSRISALVVGSFSGTKPGNNPFHLSVEEIICQAVEEYSYPVCFNAPFGHTNINHALQIGGEYTLESFENEVILSLL
ncbi:MAG: LD-carboxypeptidase [Bacteroidales bacterium]